MHALWTTVVAPLIDAYRPSTIVDLGTTKDGLAELLDRAAGEYGGSVHHGYGQSNQEPLLSNVIAPDLALVYGESNWYSVSERLDRLAEMASGGDALLPLILVHGVDWPSGRRDSYPDPTAIPLGARQPHGPREGIEQALDAHDHRNGVLTAVEDFLSGAGDELESIHVPGLGGIAILVSGKRLREDLRAAWPN